MPQPLKQPITFSRLSQISLDVIVAHMSDPRIAAHLPLMKDQWDQDTAKAFVAAKEACWTRDGLGHWAILQGDHYVGWGGFQKEGDEWDYGLVLTAEAFGLGLAITRKALAFAKADPRIQQITFLLAPSRRSLKGLDRLGAQYVGTVSYEGEKFLKYGLDCP